MINVEGRKPGPLRSSAIKKGTTPRNVLTLQVSLRLENYYGKFIEQVLAATPNKAPTIRPPASHHKNYSS